MRLRVDSKKLLMPFRYCVKRGGIKSAITLGGSNRCIRRSLRAALKIAGRKTNEAIAKISSLA